MALLAAVSRGRLAMFSARGTATGRTDSVALTVETAFSGQPPLAVFSRIVSSKMVETACSGKTALAAVFGAAFRGGQSVCNRRTVDICPSVCYRKTRGMDDI